MTNKYSEGYPEPDTTSGNEWIDMAESLCQKRALEAFHLNPDEWGVNVNVIRLSCELSSVHGAAEPGR